MLPFIASFKISLITLVAAIPFAWGTSFYPPCRRIDAAVRWSSSNVTYFFSADEYILHNDAYNVEEDVMPVNTIVSRFPTNLNAAVNWFSRRSRNGRSVYFKGCYYYKFSEAARRLRRRQRLSRLRLPCDVDAAVNTDGDTILVFKGCQYWIITRRNRRAVPGGLTSDLGLPCDVDAALTWRNGTSYVIKNDVIWGLSLSASNLTVDYQSGLEEWNLCSWNICENDGNATNNETLVEGEFACNGDPRFCSLRFDQLTMAGSHNAGSGFDGGFGFFDCWIRNHDLSVLEQLRLGVRFLDVDTDWEQCGLLGTFHNFMCGGSVCKMIKQIKQFLRENREEVIAINFNHEMRDVPRVLPALLRQVTSQLGRYVNSAYRDGGGDVGAWPLLSDAVRSDERLFVIVDKRVETVTRSAYLRHRWIHSERLLKSTWRGDVKVEYDCQEVVESSQQQCRDHQDVPLLEVSVFGYSTACVTSIADLCLPLVHLISEGCQGHRHAQGKAPNVLLVDFPERVSHAAASGHHPSSLSVAWAAFLQNVRNVYRLTGQGCRVGVGAAVTWRSLQEEEGEYSAERVVFYPEGGPRSPEGRSSSWGPLVYLWGPRVQETAESPEFRQGMLASSVDAAFRRTGDTCFVSGCDVTCFRGVTPWEEVSVTSTANMTTWGLPCHVDAALTMTERQLTMFFKGCQYWTRDSSGAVSGPGRVADMGLPCDLSAAFRAPDGAVYFFKGDQYWRHLGRELGLSSPAPVLDWSADFVRC